MFEIISEIGYNITQKLIVLKIHNKKEVQRYEY